MARRFVSYMKMERLLLVQWMVIQASIQFSLTMVIGCGICKANQSVVDSVDCKGGHTHFDLSIAGVDEASDLGIPRGRLPISSASVY